MCNWSKLTGQHGGVSTVRDGKKMRRNFITPLALVDGHGPHRVNGVTLVGIDGHTEKT